jgi:integrase/recombinase XerD
MDWRKATLSHLALWRRTVAASPVSKTNGLSGFRSESTMGLWMVVVRSFYEWADAHSLLVTDVVSRMTDLKYFAPGTAGPQVVLPRSEIGDDAVAFDAYEERRGSSA